MASSLSILRVSFPFIVHDSSILVRSPIVLSSHSSNSSIRVCAPVALLLKHRMEGVEYIKYSASHKLWVEERWKGKAICGGG